LAKILLKSSRLRKNNAQSGLFLLGCAQIRKWPERRLRRLKDGFPWQRKNVLPYRMATDKELSDFLENVERRAFKQAVYAVRKDESALDIVQDAMIKLAEKYADKPAAELPLLFQRILQNTIHDYFRREKVRSTWLSLFSSLGGDSDGHEDFDLLETYEAHEGSQASESSADKVERDQILTAIDAEVQKLPTRQREAFLMRYWEDMDVAETASAMKCSEGSVKTHCSRATHTLALALKAKGIYL
jgi:RNA polymerase sigma-70 factor (ECF subfamily)